MLSVLSVNMLITHNSRNVPGKIWFQINFDLTYVDVRLEIGNQPELNLKSY